VVAVVVSQGASDLSGCLLDLCQLDPAVTVGCPDREHGQKLTGVNGGGQVVVAWSLVPATSR
jgi:hypothetical protein